MGWILDKIFGVSNEPNYAPDKGTGGRSAPQNQNTPQYPSRCGECQYLIYEAYKMRCGNTCNQFEYNRSGQPSCKLQRYDANIQENSPCSASSYGAALCMNGGNKVVLEYDVACKYGVKK